MVLASMTPGISSADVAMSNGINPNQLHTWRRQFDRGELGSLDGVPALIPVQLAPADQEPVPTKPTMPKIPESPRQREGFIDIWVGDAQVRVHGAVNADSLRCVLEVLRA